MNKKLIVISCVAILIILPLFIFFVNRSNQARAREEARKQEAAASAVAGDSTGSSVSNTGKSDLDLISEPFPLSLEAAGLEPERKSVVLKNGIYTVTFDTKGASVSSVVLNEYKENGGDLEMICKTVPDSKAFMLYRGSDLRNPIDEVFDIERQTPDSITFRRDYNLNGKNVTLRKTFVLSEQYMLKLNTSISGLSQADLDSFGSSVYTLEFAPFLGPAPSAGGKGRSSADARSFYILDTGRTVRSFIFFKKKDGKKRGINFDGSSKSVFSYKNGFDWFEWTGKYFSAVMIPADRDGFAVSVYKRSAHDNSIYLMRNNSLKPSSDGSLAISDDVYAYIGPQLKDRLQRFDYKEDNDFGLKDLSLSKAMEGGGAFPWLQNILKFLMKIFYRWIPNWGVSIILLTLLIKLLLYPLNSRSARSAAAMQKIAPRLEEIRKEYKDDPQAQNQAIMALYKKHNVSPFSSLLPMIIQLPILFAVYGLLNKHFELRGAMFIPGWIEDLSIPETVCVLPFSLPFLGNQVHILPVIYGLSMVFSMIWTQRQSTAGQTKGFQKFMIYGLPIILFFSLYGVSSGLLVYWTVMNILSILQQIYENGKLRKADAAEKSAENGSLGKDDPNYRVLPPKAKKNKKNRR